MSVYTFVIYYSREVRLEITILEDGNYYEANCRHPMTANPTYSDLPLGESWFFYDGPDWERENELVRGSTIRNLLDHIANIFYQGTKAHFKGMGDDCRYWFRQHLYIAFVCGYLPSKDIRIPVIEEEPTIA